MQQQLQSRQRSHDIATISKMFKILRQNGNVNGALKLLTNNMSGGVLPVINETLELLIQKHPEVVNVEEYIALQGQMQQVHPILFEEIDADLVVKAEKYTKGGSGPSGLDADA